MIQRYSRAVNFSADSSTFFPDNEQSDTDKSLKQQWLSDVNLG